jgi:uncharacterized membrane protein YgdD (TMEM256/DUF423 family)
MNNKYTTMMLTGATVCMILCFSLLWRITSTGNTDVEWMAYAFLILGFILFGGAYVKEKMSASILPPISS